MTEEVTLVPCVVLVFSKLVQLLTNKQWERRLSSKKTGSFLLNMGFPIRYLLGNHGHVVSPPDTLGLTLDSR